MYDKKILICLLRLCFIAPLTCCLTAGSASAALNVKDYGARGNNSADDTEAIRAALAAAWKEYKLGRAPRTGAQYPTRPEVFFPSGRYRISDTIKGLSPIS